MRALIITLTATLAIAASVFGQENKIGYVQLELLMQNFPETEDAVKTWEKEVAGWQKQLQEYQAEIMRMEEEYKQRAMLFSPEKKREKEEELKSRTKEAVEFQQRIFGQEGEAEKRRLDLLRPIYEKVYRACDIYGQQEGYVMIFNSQGLIYAKDELDLTEEVLKILKAGVDMAPSGGAGKGPKR
ncbi:MAG: OmpH family outer membrane protein [Gemmatimonadota bacterium]|nr:OmpH family outer membrane protein [Gemmatimonadota bacterium]